MRKGRDILEDADSYDFMILRESLIKDRKNSGFILYETGSVRWYMRIIRWRTEKKSS